MKTKEEPVHLEKFTVVFYCGIYWEEESLWDLTSVKGKIKCVCCCSMVQNGK